MNINIPVNIPDDILECVLISGLEGGSNYWCIFDGSSPGEGFYFEKILGDGWVILKDVSSGDTLKLNRDKVIHGLEVMFRQCPHQFFNMLRGDSDAITGDVLIQCCFFGEVIYG